MLSQQIQAPQIFRRRSYLCAIRVYIINEAFLEIQENLLNKKLLSSFINDLDFSEKTNQIFLEIRFNQICKLLFKVFLVLNVAELVYTCNLRFEQLPGFDVDFSILQKIKMLILLEILYILWEFLQQKLKSSFCFCLFAKLKATLIQQLVIQHFVLDLLFAFVQLLIHSIVFLSVSVGNNSVQVIVS